MTAIGGGGDQQSTTSTNTEYPEETKPLFKGAAEQILALQRQLPLASFTGWNPAGVAGMSPAHQFEIDQLLPSAMAPTAGLEGLLALPGAVSHGAAGAVRASAPTGGENAAIAKLFGLAGVDAPTQAGPAMPDMSALFAALPQGRSIETIFPGLSQADIEAARPGVSAGEVPVLAGPMDSITTTQPMGPGEPPFELPQPPDLTDPQALGDLLPPAARSIYDDLIQQGVPPAVAFSQAMDAALGQASAAGQAPSPGSSSPTSGSDSSPGGF